MMLWTAFGMGLAGSLHCVGMCGPLALALPYQRGSRLQALGQVLVYNAGRVLTYAAIGVLIGLAGRGLFLAGAQAWFSLGLGVMFLLAAIFSFSIESRIVRLPGLRHLQYWVQKMLGTLMQRRGTATLFGIGMLNGLLPCGLVYMAVAGAVTAGGIAQGAAFMIWFGLGTLPLMVAVAMAGQFIGVKVRQQARKLLPVFLVIFALFFVMRGLHFAVPAEFRFWETATQTPMCH